MSKIKATKPPHESLLTSQERYELFFEEDNYWDIELRHRKLKYKFPISIILDTNWWIYLAKGEQPKSLKEIINKIDCGEFRLIVPDVIIQEWDRNLEQTRKDVEEFILDQAKNAYAISQHLNGLEQAKFRAILNNYKDKEAERLKLANRNIDKIDKIIKQKSVIIKVTDEVTRLTIKQALEKKAPFHKGNNSVADALILFSSIEYLKKHKNNEIGSSIFVSYNHNDFSKSKDDKDTIHEDLLPFLESTNTAYERNIGLAMKLTMNLQENIDTYIESKAEEELIDDYIERHNEIERNY